MKTCSTFKNRLEKARQNLQFSVQGVVVGFTEQILARMSALGVTKADFAKRLNASPAYVTKMLRGKANFTIETMVKAAKVLDSELELRICPKNAGDEWFCSESVILVSEQDLSQEFRPPAQRTPWERASANTHFRETTTHHETVTTENR